MQAYETLFVLQLLTQHRECRSSLLTDPVKSECCELYDIGIVTLDKLG